jgi:hypothetical protein
MDRQIIPLVVLLLVAGTFFIFKQAIAIGALCILSGLGGLFAASSRFDLKEEVNAIEA